MTEPRPAHQFAARGGWWVVTQSLLMLATLVLAVLFPGPGQHLLILALGFALFTIGGYCGIAGILVLGKNRTPYPQPRAGSQLVQRGIYARMRHPLYSSVMLATLGWALIWQSVAAGVAAVTLIPFFHAKARREERWLRERFPAYGEYARRVPRFLPRLSGPANLICNF